MSRSSVYVCYQSYMRCITRCRMRLHVRWRLSWASRCAKQATACGRHDALKKHLDAEPFHFLQGQTGAHAANAVRINRIFALWALRMTALLRFKRRCNKQKYTGTIRVISQQLSSFVHLIGDERSILLHFVKRIAWSVSTFQIGCVLQQIATAT